MAYADGAWIGVNATVDPFVAPTPADGPWSSVNVTIPAVIPRGDGPWSSRDVTLLPNDRAHLPVIVKRAGVLTRIRILTLDDIP